MTGDAYTSPYTNACVSTATMSVDYAELDNRPMRCAVCGRFVSEDEPLSIATRRGRYIRMRHHDCAPSDTGREREHGEA